MRERLTVMLIAALGYVYAGYPLLLLAAGALKRRPVRKGDVQPTLTIIVPAHNEERIIAAKIESIVNQDYPHDRVEILIASDGSTDGTNDIAASYEGAGVILIDRPRAGKALTLNHVAELAQHEILIFTDANAVLAPGCLKALARNFNDPEVGGVSANERRTEDANVASAGIGERLYWEYDKWLKNTESAIGSIVSASGSLYAIRREHFVPIVDLAATDDFAISTQVIRARKRLVFEPDAVTWEPPVTKEEVEFNRKVRIVTRGLRSVYGIRELLLPWNSGFYAVQLWSHKVLRRLTGFLAVALLVSTFSLTWRNWRYRVLAAGQVSFYALALTGWRAQHKRWGRKPWFLVPYYFCLSNLAATIGVVQFMRQRKVTFWEPRRDD